MSESIVVPGGDDAQAGGHTESSSAGEGKINQEDKAFQKLLSELKSERSKKREAEAKLQQVEQEKLLEQGKWKEAYEAMKTKADTSEKELKKSTAQYAFNVVKAQIEREANKLGCIDSDALIKLMDVSSIEVDDSFTVESAGMLRVLEEVRKSKPYLFTKDGKKINDGVPAGNGAIGKTDFAKMSKSELLEYAKKAGL